MKAKRLQFVFFLIIVFFIVSQSSAQQAGLGGVFTTQEKVLWLDASMLALPDGSLVGSWPDKSGNNNHAVQSNSSVQPIFRTGAQGINNFPVLRFDGANDELIIADHPSLDNSAGLSIIVVAKSSNNSGARPFISKRASMSSLYSWSMFILDNRLAMDIANTNNRALGGTLSTNTPYVFTGVSGINSQKSIFSNSNNLDNKSTQTVPRNVVDVRIGQLNAGDNRFFSGDIAEIILYRDALNGAQRLIVENLLARKYNINLGANYLIGNFSSPYDYDIIGVGTTNGLQKHILNTGGGGGIYLSEHNNSFNEPNEFVFSAHNNAVSNVYSASDLPVAVVNRANRIWKIERSQAGVVDAGNTDISIIFDFNELGLTPDLSKLHVLLFRNGTSGNFQTVAGVASNVTDGRLVFNLPHAQFQTGYYTFGKINQSVQTWYSYTSGNWENPSTWSTNPTSYINPVGLTPSTSGSADFDNVVIQNGHTVTINANNYKNFSLQVQSGAILNFQLTQNHEFGVVSGQGTIILHSENWPQGDFSLFTSASGGTISYQGSAGFELTIPRTVNNLEIKPLSTQTIIIGTDYTLNGNLSIASGTLQINNSTTSPVSLWVNKNLSLNSGANITTSTANARNRLFIRGDVLNNGSMRFTNRINPIYNSDAEDGITDVYFDNPSDNQTISLNGTSDFYKIIINKGNDDTYQAWFYANNINHFRLLGRADQQGSDNPPNCTVPVAFSLQAGTARIGTNIRIPVLNNSSGNNYNIDSDAALWIDGGELINPGHAIVVYGKLIVSAGKLEAKGAEGITIRETGTVEIRGGTTLANIIRTSIISGIHRGAYIQSGGTVTVENVTGSGDGHGSHYRFSLPYPDNSFTMTGGTLNIRHPKSGSGSGQNGGFLIGALPSNIFVSGGNLRFEINIARNFLINSTAPIFNLEMIKTHNNSNEFIIQAYQGNTSSPSIPAIPAQPLLILNNLTILNPTAGVTTTFNANGTDVTVNRNFTIQGNGRYTPGLNTTWFKGDQDSELTFFNTSLSLEFNNLVLDKSQGAQLLRLSSPGRSTDPAQSSNTLLRVNGNLEVRKGNIDYLGYRIDAYGDVYNEGVIGLGTLGRIRFNNTDQQNLFIPADYVLAGFGRMVINNPSGLKLHNNSINLIGELLMEKGIFDIQSFGIRVDELVNGAPYGIEKMIQTSGNNSDGGLSLNITKAGEYIFPLGSYANSTLRYTPLTATFTSAEEKFYLQVNPVASELSLLANNPPTPNQALRHYWRVRHSNPDIPAVIGSYVFTYDPIDLPAPIPVDFVPGKVIEGVRSHEDPININQTLRTITFNGDENPFNLEEGFYTAAHPDKFDGAVRTFYTRRFSGFPGENWTSLSTWSTEGFGGPQAGTIPGPGDIAMIGHANDSVHRVIIQNNVEVGAVIFVKNPLLQNPRLTVNNNNITVNLNQISGTGTFMYRFGTVSPTVTGDFGDFAAQELSEFIYQHQSGGPHSIPSNITVYPNLRFEGTGIFLLPETDLLVKRNLWIMSGGADARLNSGNAGNIIVNNNLRLGQLNTTNHGKLSFPATGNTRSVTIKGNIQVEGTSSSAITMVLGGNTSLEHRLVAEGNITQLIGDIILHNPTSSKIILELGGSNSAAYSRVNGNISLHRIIMNKGNHPDSVFSFNNSFSLNHPSNLAVKPVTFLNGSLVFNDPAIDITLSSGSGNAEISSTSGLTIKQGAARLNGSGIGLVLAGRLRLENSGQFLANGATNNFIQYTNSGQSVLEIAGNAQLNIAQALKGATTFTNASIQYLQTGGTVRVGTLSNSNNSPSFEIRNNNSRFRLLGGDLIIARTGESNVAFLADSCNFQISPTANIIFGEGTITPASTLFIVNSAIPLPNVLLQGSNSHTLRQDAKPMTILGNLVINSGKTFQTNSLDLRLQGNFTNPGTFTHSANNTVFMEGITQTLTGTINFGHLSINSGANVQLNETSPSEVIINGNLSIVSGSLSDNGKTIQLKGNMLNNGFHNSFISGSGGILFNGTSIQNVSGSGSLGNITLNNANGIRLQSDHNINGNILLEAGSINIESRNLRLESSTQITATGGFNASRMIYTDGSINALGISKTFPSSAFDFTFPIGVQGKYSPVRFQVTDNNEIGRIQITPINNELSAVNSPPVTDPKALNYYWEVSSIGFNNVTANVFLRYNQVDIRAGHDEALYAPARLLPTGFWEKTEDPSLVDEINNIISFLNTQSLQAEYTAGYNLPDKVATFHSIATGHWEDVLIWQSPDLSSPLTEFPYGSIVVINPEHNVQIQSNNKNAYRAIINGHLSLGSTSQHVLGKVSGTGTLSLESGILPAGRYEEFFSCGGGTLDFTGNEIDYTTSARAEKVNRIRFSGSGRRILPAVQMQVCQLLEIADQAILDNSVNGNTIVIKGNLEMQPNAGYRDRLFSSSGFVFNGDNLQIISGNFSGLNKINTLTIANTDGLQLNSNVEIDRTLNLVSGRIFTSSSAMVMLDFDANYAGGSNTSHVSGPMRKTGFAASGYTYPVGKDGIYAPAGLSDLQEHNPTTTAFTVEYFFSEPTNYQSVYPPLQRVSSIEYWNINRETTLASALVKLHWEDSERSMITHPASLRVARYDGFFGWEDKGYNSSFEEGQKGWVKSERVSDFSPFTFSATTNQFTNPLPVELLSFSAKNESESVKLEWATASEINNDFFTIERSINLESFEILGYVSGVGNSNLIQNYQFYDEQPLDGISYYRLKQTDFDGSFKYTDAVKIQRIRIAQTKLSMLIYPNPVTQNRVNISVSGLQSDEKVNLMLFDLSGRLHYSQEIFANPLGELLEQINLPTNLRKGIYILNLAGNSGKFTQKVIIN